MKKKTRVFLILLVVALILGGLGYWQRNNLEALLMSRRMSQSELADKITEQQEKTVELSRRAGVEVRSLTDEEREAIRSRKITREELIERITGTQDDGQPSSETPSPSGGEAQPQGEPSVEDGLREKLARLIAEIYVMEAEYTGWLEKANQSAIDEFNALPAAERTNGAKYSIGMRYLSYALDKEKECDAQMAELEGQIRATLDTLGEPTGLVDEIHSTYLEEKAAKKAYYLGLH